MLVLSVVSAVLMLVRTFCAVQYHGYDLHYTRARENEHACADANGRPRHAGVHERGHAYGHVRVYGCGDRCARDRDRCRACDVSMKQVRYYGANATGRIADFALNIKAL